MKPKNKTVSRRMVLIDDDVGFSKIMQAFASSRGIDLECFRELNDMGSLGRLSLYGVAIVDYDLGNMNGIEVAEYLPAFFDDMPMLLISGQNRQPREGTAWPKSVKGFMHKDKGPDKIIDKALTFLPPLDTWPDRALTKQASGE